MIFTILQYYLLIGIFLSGVNIFICILKERLKDVSWTAALKSYIIGIGLWPALVYHWVSYLFYKDEGR